VFNREYQKRATRQGIRSFLATNSFYRPAQPVAPQKEGVLAEIGLGAGAGGGNGRRNRAQRQGRRGLSQDQQLSFDFEAKHCPLQDIFPEAYE